jgi:hypothetical protein
MNSKSETYLKSRINKDISTLYDKLISKETEIEGQPILLIKILFVLGIFKELKNYEITESCVTQQESLNEGILSRALSKNPLERKEAETVCLRLMWTALSFGKRKVTKRVMVSLICNLLNLDDSEVTNTVETIIEALQLQSIGLDLVSDIESFISLFLVLSKNVNIIQNLAGFIRMFKQPKMSTEDEELRLCTFNPNVNGGVNASREKGKLFEDKSPRIHEELYTDYIQRDNKLKLLESRVNYKLNKEYTFKPKISPMSEKYKRKPKEIVRFINKSSLISYIKIISNLVKLNISLILSV